MTENSEDHRYVYGLDISMKSTGVAVYDLDEEKFVYIGSFNTEKIRATKTYKGLEIHALKLHLIGEWFYNILEEFPPYACGIERMFIKYKAESITIAKTTGVMQHLIWDVPQAFYPPKSVKLAIWHGNASKEEVEEEILKRYPDLIMANDDESDAVAVCICHLIQMGEIEWTKNKVVKKTKPKKK